MSRILFLILAVCFAATGARAQGTWQAVDYSVPGVTLSSGKPFHFNYVTGPNCTSSNKMPLMVWEHPTFEGQPWYDGSNPDPLFLVNSGLEASAFNTASFRASYPATIAVPYADQSTGNDAIENFGGWVNNGSTGSATHNSGDTGPNVFAVLGMVTWLKANVPCIDPDRVYIQGFSLGGIGAQYMMLKYNRLNGNPAVFTAGTSTGGVLEIHGYGAGPTSADVTTMQSVPVWWISGQNDTTSQPGDWNLPIWRSIAGNSNYPTTLGSSTSTKAGTSAYHLSYLPGIGHQSFDNNGNLMQANTNVLNWLFAQTSAAGNTPPSETITINPIAQQTAGNSFTVSGTITGQSTAPTLQYRDNNGTWLAMPAAGGRNPYFQPGGNGSVWNTPFGSGAVWGNPGDLDTIDIARGYNGGYTTGPVGYINSTSNYGAVYYIGSQSDGQYTFSSTNNGRSQAPDNGSTISATVHLPNGAVTPGPYPGDNPIVFADPVNYPNRQYTFGGVQIQPPGLSPGAGPFTASQGEWDYVTADNFGEDQETGNAGYNVGAGMINFCDVDPSCNPDFPKIKHGFRYSTDAHLLATNDNGDGYTLKPSSWPQKYQDYQSGINVYSGHLKAGTTLGIPMTTAMPGGLDANCQGAFWTMQHYPLLFRDQAGGGFHLTADQVADTSSYISSLRACLPSLVALLRPLRNQHQGGQDFTTYPKNGPGTRVDTGPLPLGTSAVTPTSFSFVHPGMSSAPSNTVQVRDSAVPTVIGTSNAFAVGSTSTSGSGIPSGYLSTKGNQIIASDGTNVRLACVGYNEPTGNYTSDMTVIKALGFNCARYPYYDATLNYTTMDAIVSAATSKGIRIIFDHHGNESNNSCLGQQSNGLWYDKNSNTPVAGIVWNSTDNTDGCGGTGNYTYAQFKANWVSIATRYANNPTVVGFDLHNEPLTYGNGVSSGANWGGGNGSDIKAMFEDVGGAILAVNPGVLIIAEGPINNGSKLFSGTSNLVPYSMDLSMAGTKPVNLPGKVVYSIHDYPGHISAAYPDNGPTKVQAMTNAWGFLVINGTAPVFVGELGADMDNEDGNQTADQAWAATVKSYINGQTQGGPIFTGSQQAISTDWWTFGYLPGQEPNGVLLSDGSTPKPTQKAIWQTFLYTNTSPTPPPTPGSPGTTWNPADASSAITLSSGNLVATSSGIGGVRSTTSKGSGKWCAKVTLNNITSNMATGIANSVEDLEQFLGGSGSSGIGLYTEYSPGQQIYINGASVSDGANGSTNGETVMLAMNFDTQQIWFKTTEMVTEGHGWNNSSGADPAAGTGGISLAPVGSGPWFIEVNTQDSGTQWTLDPLPSGCPSGFSTWDAGTVASGATAPFFVDLQ